MTNKEYIESRNLSFAEGLKLWDKNRYPNFSDWLKAKRLKFKVGDVLEELVHHVKYVIVGVDIRDGKTGYVYAYNMIKIFPNGCIVFTPNEDVESGNFDTWRSTLFCGACDTDPDFVKIA